MLPWGKGGLEKQPSFCHHHLLQLLLISCLMGEIAGGRLQNHLGKVKPPWVLPTPSPAGHGGGSRPGPTLTLIGWPWDVGAQRGWGQGAVRKVPKKKKKDMKRETEKDEPRNKNRTARGRGQGRETWRKVRREGGRWHQDLLSVSWGQRRLRLAQQGLLNHETSQPRGGQGRRLGEGKAGSFTPSCLWSLESLQAGERGALNPFPPLDLPPASPACLQADLSLLPTRLLASQLSAFLSPPL